MKILKSKRNENTYNLEIEVDIETLQKEMDIAFQHLSKHANVPGFRKGKITRAIFEKNYGKDMIVQEAIPNALDIAYKDALKELGLKVIDAPKNLEVGQYQENQPFSFKCDVDVQPIVKLGKYKGLKIKKESDVLPDDKIDTFLADLLKQYASLADVDRTAQKDDFIRLNMTASIDGTPYAAWTRQSAALRIGMAFYGESFDQQLIGTSIGDKKEFTLSYADDFSNKEIAGKNVVFTIEITEIKEEKLPELTDSFVKEIFQSESVTDFRNKIKEHLETEHKQKVDSQFKNDLMDAVLSDIKLDAPAPMVEREIDFSLRSYESTLKKSGSNLENYLKVTHKHIDDLKNELRAGCERNVKIGLVLESIAEKEKITVENTDIEAEIHSWKIPDVATIEDVKKKYPNFDLDNLKSTLMEKKVFDFLISETKTLS